MWDCVCVCPDNDDAINRSTWDAFVCKDNGGVIRKGRCGKLSCVQITVASLDIVGV